MKVLQSMEILPDPNAKALFKSIGNDALSFKTLNSEFWIRHSDHKLPFLYLFFVRKANFSVHCYLSVRRAGMQD